VLVGVLAAVLAWVWVLLVPALAEAAGHSVPWPVQGPFGLAWLAPDTMFGLGEWSRIGRATALSLLAGALVTWMLASRLDVSPDRAVGGGLSGAGLREVAARFLPAQRVDAALGDTGADAAVPAEIEQRIERELAAVLGAASARLLLDAARREQGRDLDTVATIVGEASQALRFNQRVLEAALENMSQGISVVDAELRLVAWNRRYAELFDYPAALLQVGVPVAELVAHNIGRGLAGPGRGDGEVAKRIAHMRAGTPYVAERRFGETVVEIRGNPMPGGGFVATFTDVTAFRRNEQALKSVAETLEQRVIDRTAELAGAKGEAERANRAKTRFLAAVSHDLAQPLNAAHLFVHALAPRLSEPGHRQALDNIDGALGSAESLLAGLLDISRLDAGGMEPREQVFRIGDLVQHLAAEFRVLAAEKGLPLDCVGTGAWVRSDPQLLRRVLQNFLGNAVKYTARGRILVGFRRRGDALSIEVWDTGPGIAESDQGLIFEEFRRLDRGGQGLGLGLAIAERIARLLGHPLRLRSWPGRGTVFAIDVPRAAPAPVVAAPPEAPTPEPPRSRVLVVDNDADVLRGMQALLGGWLCEVLAARDGDEAQRLAAEATPDLLLLDFHLDGGDTGLALRERLAATIPARPCVIITADHSAEVRDAVAAAGCVLLHKPLKPLALKSAMARLLAR
jgi:signal transduction histidine kinase/CheY-like chemotaxis protein